jgi:hypothetical protein
MSSETPIIDKYTCPKGHVLKVGLVMYPPESDNVWDPRSQIFRNDIHPMIQCDRCKEKISVKVYCCHCDECQYDVCFKCLPPDYDTVGDNYVLWMHPTPQGKTYFYCEDKHWLDLITVGMAYMVHERDRDLVHITTKKEYFYFLEHGRFKRNASIQAESKIKEYYKK